MSLEAFRRIQIAKEATRGTILPATLKLIGTLTMTPEIDWHRPVDERNSLAEFRRSIATGQRAALSYEGAATYEQLIHFLGMAIEGVTTPTTPGGGILSRDWSYQPALTGRHNQNAYTFEYGDETQEFESAFCMIDNLELGLALNDVLTVRADMFGYFPAKSSFTGALSDPSVIEVVANHAKLYIDGTWATLGTTEKASLLTGATWRLATGLIPIKYADGSLDFSAFMEQRRHLEVDMDLAMGADGVTEYDAAVAGTDRAIRIELVGAIIESAITYNVILDTFGRYEQVPEIFGVRDGENILALTLLSHEETVTNNDFEVIVTNKETAL